MGNVLIAPVYQSLYQSLCLWFRTISLLQNVCAGKANF
jgi:hypothetical protein